MLIPGDTFTFTLPEGLIFEPISGTVKDQGKNVEYANWGISGRTLTVTMTDGIKNLVDNIWGLVGFNGTFQYLDGEGGEETKTEIVFGGQTIYITRKSSELDPQPPAQSKLDKSYTYDPTTNELTWEVNITPPDGETDYDYSGFTLTDTLTGNHTYKEGSFKVNGNTTTPSSVSGDQKVLTYTFPANHMPKNNQIITYVTTVGTIIPGAANNFTNTAGLNLGDHPAATDVSSTFQMGGFFSKIGGTPVLSADGKSAYVQWRVSVTLPRTPNGTFTYPNARIIDALATDNHEFVEDDSDHPIQITIPGGTPTTVLNGGGAGQYSLSGTDSKTLTYYFSNGHPTTSTTGTQTYTLTYYTKIANWDESLDTNKDVMVKNSAKFVWDHKDGSGTGTWIGGEVGVEKTVVSRGGLISKSTTTTNDFDHSSVFPDVKSDYIKWTVVVNRNKVPMSGISITDAVQAGHELVIDPDHKLTVQQNTGTPEAFAGARVGTNGTLDDITTTGFKFTFASAESSDTYIVTFYTKITQAGLGDMYRNGTKTFENKVTLNGHGTTGITVSSTKTYNIQMLNKAIATSYDYETRKIQYKLVVNRNRLPMTNAVITDMLPDNLVLSSAPGASDDSSPFSVSVNGGATQTLSQAGIDFDQKDSGFSLILPAETHNDKYEIFFWTHLEDEALLTETSIPLKNEAVLKLDEKNGEIKHDVSFTVRNEIIKKEHDYLVGSTDDTVRWTVEINPAQVNLQNAVVEDILHDALSLINGSVELYLATVDSNGELTQGTPQTLGPDQLKTGIKEGKEYFELTLPDGPHAYILKFATVITRDNVIITNSIKLTGSSTSAEGNSDSTGIAVGDLYANGGSGEYVLKVKKVDEAGNPMKDVSFRLLTSNMQPFKYRGTNPPSIIQTTDENGLIEFTKLPNWVFYLEEIDPPAGYLRAPITGGVRPSEKLTGENADLNIIIENHLAVAAEIKISKMSSAEDPEDRKPLSGGQFGIYDHTDTQVGPLVSAVNGEISFTDIPLGTYTIREVSPPSGYLKTDRTLTVTVKYNTDKTDTEIEFAPDETDKDTLVNDPAPYIPGSAKISVLKTDGDGAKLPGAVFTLYDSTGKTVASAVSNADGIAEFTNVAPNASYTIRETAAPEGYALSDEVISVTTGDGTTHSFTMVNKKLDEDRGSIVITKTDENGVLLPGASFTLYDADGKAIVTAVSDAAGMIRFADIPVGNYTIRETAAPEGFVLSTEVLSITLEKDATRSFTFINRRDEVPGGSTGSIGLLKVNRNGERLAGAEFSLYGADGTLVARAVTGDDGIARFTGLPFGSYSVRETVAPAGYKLFEGAQSVTITAATPDRSFTLRNAAEDEPEVGGWEEIPDEEVPGGPGDPGTKLPQTGGVPQTLFLLLAGTVLLGVGLFTLKGQKKQRPAAPGTDK